MDIIMMAPTQTMSTKQISILPIKIARILRVMTKKNVIAAATIVVAMTNVKAVLAMIKNVNVNVMTVIVMENLKAIVAIK